MLARARAILDRVGTRRAPHRTLIAREFAKSYPGAILLGPTAHPDEGPVRSVMAGLSGSFVALIPQGRTSGKTLDASVPGA